MVLDRNASNFFAENEQIAFGTGVLVDGLDCSDDKRLVGRTFSYSDTQRYRVGPQRRSPAACARRSTRRTTSRARSSRAA
jgi:catalase